MPKSDVIIIFLDIFYVVSKIQNISDMCHNTQHYNKVCDCIDMTFLFWLSWTSVLTTVVPTPWLDTHRPKGNVQLTYGIQYMLPPRHAWNCQKLMQGLQTTWCSTMLFWPTNKNVSVWSSTGRWYISSDADKKTLHWSGHLSKKNKLMVVADGGECCYWFIHVHHSNISLT